MFGLNNTSLLADGSNSSGNDEGTSATLNALRIFNFWFLFLLIVVGFSGNVFAAVAICRSSKLRRISSNHYLVALALSDNVFVFGLFMIWLNRLDLPTYHYSQAACKIVLFLLNSSGCLSAWYVMVLTIERFIVVYYPLYRQSICSVGRTRRAIVILVPWPLLFNIWILFASGLDPIAGICDILPQYYRLSMILNGVDMGISFVIPVLVIVSLNMAICIRLWTREQTTFAARPGTQRFSVMRRAKKSASAPIDPNADKVHLTALKPSGGAGEERGKEDMRKHTGSNAKMQNQERKITKTLLIISFVYVALNVPSYSIRLRDSLLAAAGATASDMSLVEKIMRNIFLLIYYMNFAMNFIVYSLSSKNFRDAVKRMWVTKQRSPPTTSTATTCSSYRSTSVRTRLVPSRSPSPCPTASARSSPNLGANGAARGRNDVIDKTGSQLLPIVKTSEINQTLEKKGDNAEASKDCSATSATLYVL